MKDRIVVHSTQIPAAVGPYSTAIMVDNLLFMSGQLPLNPKTGNIVEENIQVQTRQVLENITQLLKLHSFTLSNIVKTTVFLKNMDDFAIFNQIYAEYFSEKYPARSCVEVSRLPKNSLIEIEAIAMP